MTGSATGGTVEAELVITGMTCGSCAARIERRLNRLDGVSATVNYATGRAYFTSLGGRDAPELISVVNSTGYQAALPTSPQDGKDSADPVARDLGRRLAVCTPLAVVVIILSMVPAWQFTGWQWVSLLLAAPVAGWGAWPLYRAALAGLGHAAATMDTLVSLAVAASFGWSVYALLFGGAGIADMRMPFALTFTTASGMTLYLEAAAGVTTAVLAGRYLEARARDRSTSALTALAELGAKSVAVLRDGAERRVPVSELAAGDLFVVRPGEKIAADGVVADGSSAIDASLVTGESVPVEVGEGDQVTGATVNIERPARRPRHPRRRGHAARPDHPPGHARAGEQGERAATGRPDRRRLRARRDQPGHRDPRLLAWRRPSCHARLERRRRGSRGRVPVRARACHSHRARGRRRPRRRARHPGQERAGA